MNKYQKAWSNVYSLSETSDYYKPERDKKDIDLIKELVDKATQMKANDKDYECPKCHHSFVNYEGLQDETLVNDFCQFCGQALDWSKE